MASGWAKKLKEYNQRHGRDPSETSPLEREDTEEDKRLLKETYTKFKGEDTLKYSALPKFYSKVRIKSANC